MLLGSSAVGLVLGAGIVRLANREIAQRAAAPLGRLGAWVAVLVTGAVFGAVGVTLSRYAQEHHQQVASDLTVGEAPLSSGSFAVLAVVAAYWFCAALCVLLSIIDFRTHALPNRFVLPSFAITAVLLTLATLGYGAGWAPLLRAIAAGTIAYGALYVMCLIGGLGFGDVKLGAILGSFCGWLSWGTPLLAVVFAFLLGGLVAVVLVFSGRASRKTAVPFGPWLCIGALGAMLLFAGSPL